MKNLLSIILLCILCPFSRAEVFSLWNFHGGGDAWNTDSPAAVLAPARLKEERIIADGHELKMKVSLIRTSLDVCLSTLRQRCPNGVFALNQNSLLMELKNKDGSRRRVYLISIGGVYPVMCFSMTIPPKGKSKLEWPSEFPLPPGSTPVSVIQFPDRNATYASFKSTFGISNSLGHLASSLKTGGWHAATAEHQSGLGGTGEIFLNKDASQMLIIGFVPDKNGHGCMGTIYRRMVKKE